MAAQIHKFPIRAKNHTRGANAFDLGRAADFMLFHNSVTNFGHYGCTLTRPPSKRSFKLSLAAGLLKMGKHNAAVKEAPHTSDAPSSGDNSDNSGIANAAREAWGGLSKFGAKAWNTTKEVGGTALEKGKEVGSTVVEKGQEALHKGKEVVQSKEGQKVIKQAREGAADTVEALGGHSSNRTVNEVVRNAKIIPGAGNVLDAAEALSDSGVTRKMRDGGGTVNKEALIRGAVKVAPVSGDAARLKSLADRTGVTDRATDFVQQKIEENRKGEKAQPTTEDANKQHEVQKRSQVKR